MTEIWQTLLEWLLTPLSGSLQRQNPPYFLGHGLLTTLALGFLMPLGGVLARYFKVTKKQDWPREVDSTFWWQSHLVFSYLAVAALLIGVVILWPWFKGFDLRDLTLLSPIRLAHIAVGWTMVLLCIFIVLTGWLRGTKGGPTDKQIRGDHYDLSPRRLWFEATHKKASYAALVLSMIAIAGGLFAAGSPRWTLIVIATSWLFWVLLAFKLELSGRQIPTYQATWGLKPEHPGNRRRYPKDRRF
jgi:hypothetical protein